ncbi:alpha/beta hydrolase family protein [Aquimarina algiphila]|uniref:alpha/beta hydrolase family protein n=1 Tax=Aquimarina algiphila TaxID=2047982 RepID=UPI00248F9A4F|nr:prolyl oligopeptidase family serine peptidase [Aquimarina algiphila]
MKKNQFLIFLMILSLQVFSQTEIYNKIEIELKQPYEEISSLGKYRYDSLSYLEAQSQKQFIYEKFSYKSDGLEIEGLSCIPKNRKGKKIPVIIYNRGGTGNYGRLSEEDLPDFYWLAKNGFAVFASNYRFVDELGRVDQVGGDDVNDVLNLIKLVKEIEFVDTSNIFMMGISRGGQMTYQSLKEIKLNAAAVLGGVADLELQAKNRPIFINGWSDLEEEYNYKGLQNILPDFENNKEHYLNMRSAVKWADQINTPVYILHSRQDGRVSVMGAIEMARQLQLHKKEFKLKIYDKKSHSLPYSKFDSFQEIVNWFKSHLKF